MNTINASNIIEQWTSLTPQLRQNFYKTYIKAMSECDLVAQWDKMTDTQKLYLHDLYKKQRNAKYKIHKKKAKTALDEKDTAIKMDNFNQRFILNIMNKHAPKGYRFIITGHDRKIAIESAEIMGDQKPRGAFVSDISFDMIEGIFGSIFKNDKEAFDNDTIYWRMRSFIPEKPFRTTKEKFEQYVKTLDDVSRQVQPCLETIQKKPFMPLFRKNSIIVQGIMDSGKPAPKYLNDRLHNYVNGIVWWTFRCAMRHIKASKLVKYRNRYKKTMNRLNIVPEKHSEFTMWRNSVDQKEQQNMRERLDTLQYDMLPKAVENKDHNLILSIKQNINKLNKILGPDYEEKKAPARHLMPQVFYTQQKRQKNTTGITTNQTQERQFPANMPVIKQLWLLVTAREQKTK